jgi:hypothetical protein
VDFSYQPASWSAGVAVSLVGVIALLVELVIFSKRANEVDAG